MRSVRDFNDGSRVIELTSMAQGTNKAPVLVTWALKLPRSILRYSYQLISKVSFILSFYLFVLALLGLCCDSQVFLVVAVKQVGS